MTAQLSIDRGDIPPNVPTGSFKTLGPRGPKYEVGKPLRKLADGDWLIEIILLQSRGASETAESRLSDINADPEAL